jgi:hypothetical protein
MASVSKAKRKANPGLTRNGRVRLRSLSLVQLQEMLEKARPRVKHKIVHFMNNIVKKTKE